MTTELVLGREMKNPFFTSNSFRRDIAQGAELEKQLIATFDHDRATHLAELAGIDVKYLTRKSDAGTWQELLDTAVKQGKLVELLVQIAKEPLNDAVGRALHAVQTAVDAKNNPSNGVTNSDPVKPETVPRRRMVAPWMSLAILLVGVAIGVVGTLVTRRAGTEEVLRRPTDPVVLIGSGNVYAFLARSGRLDLHGLQHFWVDLRSNSALSELFAAFEYGGASGKNRVGVIAMSSAGSVALEEELARQPIRKENNYFLAITIARRPVFAFYRGILDERFHLERPGFANQPSDGPRRYVSLPAIATFLKGAERPTLFVPETLSGTRAAIDRAAEGRGIELSWPETLAAPRHLENVQGMKPFLTFNSEPPVEPVSSGKTICTQMREMKIETAALCAEEATSGRCIAPVIAEFVIAMKLSQNGSGGFRISNSAECAVASSFVPDIQDCTVREVGASDSHIVTRNANTLEAATPEYLQCN